MPVSTPPVRLRLLGCVCLIAIALVVRAGSLDAGPPPIPLPRAPVPENPVPAPPPEKPPETQPETPPDAPAPPERPGVAESPPPVVPELPPRRSGEERRTVIALHNTTTVQPPFYGNISQLLECPLNYLGMVLRHHHVRDGPPPAAWLADARAVITWFDYGAAAPAWVLPWLLEQVPDRVPFVLHFGSLQPLHDANKADFTAWLDRLGLEWLDGYLAGPARVDVEFKVGRKLSMFEGNPLREATYEGPRSVTPGHRIWVQTKSRANPARPACTPVLTAPWGGVALQPWVARIGAGRDERRWYLHPFAFFREALQLERVPAPQPAVLFGRRMFFFHVDGDGFESVSWIDNTKRCGELFRKEIAERFQIPCTLSIIVASVTDRLRPERPSRLMTVARDLFALPYVEIASHGVLHPFDWSAEFADDPDVRKKFAYPGLKGFDYTPVHEVRDSIEFIRRYLAPHDKDCVGMLWTGDCMPPLEAILEAGRLKCWNLNVGTYRWDSAYDSAGFVSPWARRVGPAVQVCAGAANDNEFPGFYDNNPTAFAGVDTTIERSGSPRILKPANVYAHFYSVERSPRMVALKSLLTRWAIKEPTIPVHASTYVQAVNGAMTARVIRTDTGWTLRDFGQCRTVRLDDEPRHIHLGRSTGIDGFRRQGSTLHVHLAGPTAEIVLSESVPRLPYLEEANCSVEAFLRTAGGVKFRCFSFVPRIIVLGGFEAAQPVRVTIDGAELFDKADGQGRVTLKLPRGGHNQVDVQEQ